MAYVSAEGRSCLRKARNLLGFGSGNVRIIPKIVPSGYRLPGRRPRPGRRGGHGGDGQQRGDRPPGRRPGLVASSRSLVPLRCGLRRAGRAVEPIAERTGGPERRQQPRSRPPTYECNVPVEAGLSLMRDRTAMRDGVEVPRGDGFAAAVEHDLAPAERLAACVGQASDLELVADPSLAGRCTLYPISHSTTPSRKYGRLLDAQAVIAVIREEPQICLFVASMRSRRCCK